MVAPVVDCESHNIGELTFSIVKVVAMDCWRRDELSPMSFSLPASTIACNVDSMLLHKETTRSGTQDMPSTMMTTNRNVTVAMTLRRASREAVLLDCSTISNCNVLFFFFLH